MINLDKIIEDKETFLNELKAIRDKIKEAQEASDYQKQAFENSAMALFDGLKIITSEENPLELRLPQYVKPNLYLRYNDKIYISLKDGIVDENNFEEYLEPLYLEEEPSDEEFGEQTEQPIESEVEE